MDETGTRYLSHRSPYEVLIILPLVEDVRNIEGFALELIEHDIASNQCCSVSFFRKLGKTRQRIKLWEIADPIDRPIDIVEEFSGGALFA